MVQLSIRLAEESTPLSFLSDKHLICMLMLSCDFQGRHSVCYKGPYWQIAAKLLLDSLNIYPTHPT